MTAAQRLDPRRDEVHRRRAHETGDEEVGGIVVDPCGDPNCCTSPAFMTAILSPRSWPLDLVVGHIDDGGAHAVVELLDLGTHLDAQLGVEVGERLVEQEQRRITQMARPMATR